MAKHYGDDVVTMAKRHFADIDDYLLKHPPNIQVTKSKIIHMDDLPKGWSKTTHNGFTHVKDANGNMRIRIDPPDAKTPYPHKHLYDEIGNALDINGNVVRPKSPDAHIPLK